VGALVTPSELSSIEVYQLQGRIIEKLPELTH
jgi:hypothetical protein